VLRVVLADDNLLVRQGLAGVLALDPDVEVVAQCTDYDDLLAAVDEHLPDVVLTDIRMPPTHTDEGVRAANAIRDRHPGMGVLVLSQYDSGDHALLLFERGAARRGYLLKDHVADPGQLTSALRQVAAGGSSIDPTVVETMLGARTAKAGSPLLHLTPREREVLGEMARGHTNGTIAATLHLTIRAVERHINSIFAKLGLAEEPDYHRRVRAVLLFLADA
jgi:DNA-binding NarL/FixJ family response regulator